MSSPFDEGIAVLSKRADEWKDVVFQLYGGGNAWIRVTVSHTPWGSDYGPCYKVETDYVEEGQAEEVRKEFLSYDEVVALLEESRCSVEWIRAGVIGLSYVEWPQQEGYYMPTDE